MRKTEQPCHQTLLAGNDLWECGARTAAALESGGSEMWGITRE
jgi:hypothetical protein